jgi:type IV secretion system protein VirD4
MENKVLSQNVRFRYDSDTLRNNNVFVVGGSGAGKTAFFLTPNLMSLHDCNIYTDPKGGLAEELGAWLSGQKDTRVYTLNLCEMEKSMHFNPFPYI